MTRVFKSRWTDRLAQMLGLATLVLALDCGALAQQAARELFQPVTAASSGDQSTRVNKLRAQPTTKSLELVRVDIGALQGADSKLTMPGQQSLTFDKKSVESTGRSDFIWRGALRDVPGTATLVVRDGNVTGTVQNGSDVYRIEPVGGGTHALIKLDTSKFPRDEPPGFEKKQRERRGDIAPLGTRADQRSDGPVGIDVMVGYTAGAASNVSDIVATIQLAVAEANQSYTNSAINIRLNLVDTFKVAEDETGKSHETILADFIANNDVKQHRTSSGADLSALIINQADYCGLADAIQADASTAYAIVHYSCATGYYSFAHELGHLMGARHDPGNDSTLTPFAYGHGFQHSSPAPTWRTIMAYDCSGGCPRLQYWSNPNINYNNVAMGTAAANDNARVLNGTAGTVAAFNNPPGGGWRAFELAPGAAAGARTHVAAVSRIPTSMEVFWIASNGSVQDAFWYEGAPWRRFELAPGGSASAGGGIAAVSRIKNSMEVFWIGADGSVQDAYWYEGAAWKRFTLAGPGSAAPSSPISVVSRIPTSMEVFWVAPNGSVRDAYWYDGGAWKGFELAPAGAAATGGGISAVSRIKTSMEVFWIGPNGSVQDAYWYEGAPWKRFELAPANSAAATGAITSVSRKPGTMEVFWTAPNGSVQDAYWYEGAPWRRFELAPAGSASTNGGIKAVSRRPNTMELWWPGPDGSIQDAYWYENAVWRRFALAPPGRSAPGGGVAAVSRVPVSMEVWWIGSNTSVQDSFFYE